MLGAVVLVVLAFRARDHGGVTPTDRHPVVSRRRFVRRPRGRSSPSWSPSSSASVLLGDAKLLLGDVANWVTGRAGRVVTYVLDTRVPRVVGRAAGGAALALAGTLVQAVTRNPLAEPGILGVSGGAGLGAVAARDHRAASRPAGESRVGRSPEPSSRPWSCSASPARGGFPQNRLVLIGIGVSPATAAAISLLIVLTDPFNGAKALTWLSGSTYGRTLGDALPVVAGARGRARRGRAAAPAPRPARAGRRHPAPPRRLRSRSRDWSSCRWRCCSRRRPWPPSAWSDSSDSSRRTPPGRWSDGGTRAVLPVAVLLGAVLVCAADVLGRTVIAPAQLGAGLLTAVIGTPYFVWLLWRGRASAS